MTVTALMLNTPGSSHQIEDWMENCPTGIKSIIDQLHHGGCLEGRFYAHPLPVLNHATLGQHIRHIHDFYKSTGSRNQYFGGRLQSQGAQWRNRIIFDTAMQRLRHLIFFFLHLTSTKLIICILTLKRFLRKLKEIKSTIMRTDVLVMIMPSIIWHWLESIWISAIHSAAFLLWCCQINLSFIKIKKWRVLRIIDGAGWQWSFDGHLSELGFEAFEEEQDQIVAYLEESHYTEAFKMKLQKSRISFR